MDTVNKVLAHLLGEKMNRTFPTEYPGPFATVTVVYTPECIPIVRDIYRFGVDAIWKFTGGEGRLGETPLQGALREVEEESGVFVPPALLIPWREPFVRPTYTIYAFVAVLPTLPQDGTLKRRGDEGEEIDVVSPMEIRRMADDLVNPDQPRRKRPFLYFHYDMFIDFFQALVPDDDLVKKWGRAGVTA